MNEPTTTGQRPTYLVWSNEHRTWWGPNNSGYTGDVWSAGRYTYEAARQACNRRDWPQGAPPPEVMVPAPEHGRPTFTVAEIRSVPKLMRQRIADATRDAVTERARLALAAAEDEHAVACFAECGHAARADEHRAAALKPAGRPA